MHLLVIILFLGFHVMAFLWFHLLILNNHQHDINFELAVKTYQDF